MFRFALLALLLTGLTGCKEESIDPLRLDHTVVPLSQRIALSLDPDQDVYYGSQSTEIKVNEPTTTFRLHARDLGIINMQIKGNGVNEVVTHLEGEKGRQGRAHL